MENNVNQSKIEEVQNKVKNTCDTLNNLNIDDIVNNNFTNQNENDNEIENTLSFLSIANKNENISSNENDKDNRNGNEFNNFMKSKFSFKNTPFELGVSIYSNMIFVIISSNSKLGSFYIGECENRDLLDPMENLYDVQCLLGDRKDEANEFLCNTIITYIFNSILDENNIDKFSKIEKVMLSTSIKFKDLFNLDNGNDDDSLISSHSSDIVEKKEFREFLSVVKAEIKNILNFN